MTVQIHRLLFATLNLKIFHHITFEIELTIYCHVYQLTRTIYLNHLQLISLCFKKFLFISLVLFFFVTATHSDVFYKILDNKGHKRITGIDLQVNNSINSWSPLIKTLNYITYNVDALLWTFNVKSQTAIILHKPRINSKKVK